MSTEETLVVPRRWMFGAMVVLLVFLALLSYSRALRLPLIADDYVQIELGREYGPISGWGALSRDALYRCRSTSILVTYWTEQMFGLNPLAFNTSSLLLHIVNAYLVFLLGIWSAVGWRVSAIAAAVFVIDSHPQEAVIWYAALPELLVFGSALSSLLCWVMWVQGRHTWAYVGCLTMFVLALLSKESAVMVVPLMTLVLLISAPPCEALRRLPAILPFAVLSIVYFLLGYVQQSTHLHYRDGTFSLDAPFWRTVINSIGRLLWVWGILAVAALAWWRSRGSLRLMGIAVVWMAIALLPYSFLTYMSRVPSRHMYFAVVGVSLMIAAALLELWNCRSVPHRGWTTAALATLLVVCNAGYIQTRKYNQFVLRAAPTEQLISIVDQSSGPVYLKCFPYDESVAILAVRQRTRVENRWRQIVIGKKAALEANAFDLCNAVTGRGRF